jgi:CheY-like chemotaxis protein
VPEQIPTSGLRGRERILVVDDESLIADVLTMGLDRLGYEVVTLNEPREAIETFTEDPSAWDVVVSDQVMPEIKGLALCKRLKKICPSLRFILCTGYSEGVTEESAIAAGADAFFMKPASPADIAGAIRKLLDRPTSDEALASPNQGMGFPYQRSGQI